MPACLLHHLTALMTDYEFGTKKKGKKDKEKRPAHLTHLAGCEQHQITGIAFWALLLSVAIMYKRYIFSHVLQHGTAPHRTTGCLVRAIQNISPAALVICGCTKGFLYYIRGRFFLFPLCVRGAVLADRRVGSIGSENLIRFVCWSQSQ